MNENRPNGISSAARLVIQPDGLEIPEMDKAFAEHFAADWIDSWNSHDLDRVLSHYTDDFEMTSPMIIQIDGERSGTLRGKAAVGRYWRKALALIPDLHFELIAVLAGVTSITLYYKGAGGRLAAEVFHFGAERRVTSAFAHYDLSAVPSTHAASVSTAATARYVSGSRPGVLDSGQFLRAERNGEVLACVW